MSRQSLEMYGAKKPPTLNVFKRMGFDQVIVENIDMAEAANRHGLKVVLANWWTNETSWNQIESQIEGVSKLKRLVSVNMMDEAILQDGKLLQSGNKSLHPPNSYANLRRKIHRRWPGVPLSLSFFGPQPSWSNQLRVSFLVYMNSVDLLRVNIFPVVDGSPLRLVYDWIQDARILMHSLKRKMPLTVTLQTWASGEDFDGLPQLPPIAAVRVMALMALLCQVDTVSFFDYNPSDWKKVRGFAPGFNKLVRELASLRDQIRRAHVTSVMGGDGIFSADFKTHGKKSRIEINTLFTPNLSFAPLQVRRV